MMTSQKTYEVKKMNENIENTKNIYAIPMRDRIKTLEKQNSQLKNQNQLMADELTYFKTRCADLEDEIQDMKNTRKYLTSKDAGKKFAESLLGGA